MPKIKKEKVDKYKGKLESGHKAELSTNIDNTVTGSQSKDDED